MTVGDLTFKLSITGTREIKDELEEVSDRIQRVAGVANALDGKEIDIEIDVDRDGGIERTVQGVETLGEIDDFGDISFDADLSSSLPEIEETLDEVEFDPAVDAASIRSKIKAALDAGDFEISILDKPLFGDLEAEEALEDFEVDLDFERDVDIPLAEETLEDLKTVKDRLGDIDVDLAVNVAELRSKIKAAIDGIDASPDIDSGVRPKLKESLDDIEFDFDVDAASLRSKIKAAVEAGSFEADVDVDTDRKSSFGKRLGAEGLFKGQTVADDLSRLNDEAFALASLISKLSVATGGTITAVLALSAGALAAVAAVGGLATAATTLATRFGSAGVRQSLKRLQVVFEGVARDFVKSFEEAGIFENQLFPAARKVAAVLRKQIPSLTEFTKDNLPSLLDAVIGLTEAINDIVFGLDKLLSLFDVLFESFEVLFEAIPAFIELFLEDIGLGDAAPDFFREALIESFKSGGASLFNLLGFDPPPGDGTNRFVGDRDDGTAGDIGGGSVLGQTVLGSAGFAQVPIKQTEKLRELQDEISVARRKFDELESFTREDLQRSLKQSLGKGVDILLKVEDELGITVKETQSWLDRLDQASSALEKIEKKKGLGAQEEKTRIALEALEEFTNLNQQFDRDLIGPLERSREQVSTLESALKKLSDQGKVDTKAFKQLQKLLAETEETVKRLKAIKNFSPDFETLEAKQSLGIVTELEAAQTKVSTLGQLIETALNEDFDKSSKTVQDLNARLKNAQERLRNLKLSESLASELEKIRGSLRIGRITELEAAKQRVDAIAGAIQRARELGFAPASEEVRDLKTQLQQAKLVAQALEEDSKALFSLDGFEESLESAVEKAKNLGGRLSDAVLGFADDISQGLGESIGGALFKDTEQLARLRDRRRRIQQNLRQARGAGNVDQIRQLTRELDRVNRKISQGATLAGRLGQAFRNFGQVAKQALQSFVSQVIAAIAKLAALKIISSLLTGGIGGLGGSGLGMVGSGLPGGGLGAVPMAASGGFVQSTGLAVIHKGENIIPKGGAMAGGSVSTGPASLNGDTIEIPVRMINDGNRIGSRNKGRAGRA